MQNHTHLVTSNKLFQEYNIANESIEEKIKKIKLILPELSSISNFDDLKWILNLQKKAKNMSIDSYTIYFTNIPAEYLEIVKLHTLLIALTTINRAIDFPAKITHLFNFCNSLNIKLPHMTLKHFKNFELYLSNLKKENGDCYHPDTIFKIWSAAQFFYSSIQWYPAHPYIKELKHRKTPIRRHINTDKEAIPNEYLYQLDKAFKDQNIAIHFRTAYWFLRLFPLRVNEILNLEINCYKCINEDFVLLTFPDIKTNGGYATPAYRSELLYLRERYQFELFSLIQEQQSQALKLQKYEIEKNLLFSYNSYGNQPRILTRSYFGVLFRKLQKKLFVQGSSFTVHQLRTTGATLRAEHGFTSLQLKELLNINLNTVASYSKMNNKSLIKLQNKILEQENKPRAFFKGRIINSKNSHIENQIILNPLAHKLPDMGYCSYENKCGNHFECLECEYLIPDIDLLEYYREIGLKQIEKSEFWAKKGNDIYRRDNLHRATLFTKLYEKALIAKGEIQDVKQ